MFLLSQQKQCSIIQTNCFKIKGSKLLFGGEALQNHSILYGAIKPTAVFTPLTEILKDDDYELVTEEIFCPFQILTEYKHDQLPLVLNIPERMHAHLTAAVVSYNPLLLQDVIGHSVNGTTYAGLRERTTGAPQNHWLVKNQVLNFQLCQLMFSLVGIVKTMIFCMFGPAGDPRGAGIGTPEAIKLRPLPEKWETPKAA